MSKATVSATFITSKMSQNHQDYHMMIDNDIMLQQVLSRIILRKVLMVSKFTSTHSSVASNLTSWCAQTPYSESCDRSVVISQKSEFPNIVMQIALDQAIYAQKLVKWGTKYKIQNASEMAALSDCSQLLDDSMYRLNLVMKHPNCTFADRQTWLGMALANVETCITGFNELGILDHPLLPLANNLSKSLSNALAVCHDAADEQNISIGDVTWASDAYKTLLEVSTNDLNFSFVVAHDGSGQGRTIKEAIRAAARRTGDERFVIYVKEGTYNEYIQINRPLKNIMIFGDGIGKTIITGNKRAGKSITSSQTATFGITGDGFIARDITFQNTAGPLAGQALALRAQSDLSVFYRCSFEGHQDTLYVHSGRQFYRECNIYGTVDFIFGDAAAVFQNCNIYARKPPQNTITIIAQNRSNPKGKTGIIIQNSKVTSREKNLKGVSAYLGRPWGPYSQTVVMGCFLDGFIDPTGWLRWDVNANVSDVYYAEFNNSGPGSSTKSRVDWKGYHAITDRSEVLRFTVKEFLSGESWLPSTDVPYNPGL